MPAPLFHSNKRFRGTKWFPPLLSIGIMLLFRDIKPDNLLLDARGHVKLSGDFYNHHDHLDYYRSSEIIIILNITIYIRFWAVHGAEEVSQNWLLQRPKPGSQICPLIISILLASLLQVKPSDFSSNPMDSKRKAESWKRNRFEKDQDHYKKV